MSNQSLQREIGLFGGISVIAGIMIGSGIFYIGGIVLERAAMSPGLALLSWIIGGIVSLLCGVCYAELGAMMPKAGGAYVYLREAYGERWAFLKGLTIFALAGSGSIAALAVAFAAAISSVIPMGRVMQKTLAIATIVILTAINLRGVKTGAFVQNLFMVLKLLPIVVLMGAGLFFGTESPDLLAMPAEMPSIGTMLSMIGFAVVATLWAYEGWTNLNALAEEMKNPARNLPWAIIVSIIGVTLLYVGFNYSLFRVIPMNEIVTMIESGNYYIGTEAALRLFGETGMVIVGAAMILAIFNSLNGCIMVFPRIYYAMARDGAMFESMAKVSPTRRVPVVAIIGSAVVSIALVLLRNLSELTSLVAVAGLVFNVFTLYTVVVLRRKYPTMERPYKVWFYPTLIYVAIAVSVAILINSFIEDPVTAIMGFAVELGGLIFYELVLRKKSERVRRAQELAQEGAAQN